MSVKSIGIDLGHCETAAACPQKSRNGEYNVIRLDTAEGNRQVINTQIILTNAQMEKLADVEIPSYELLQAIGPFKIGNCPAYVPDGERFIYFKVAPKFFNNPCGYSAKAKECNITHAKIMACYVYALVENIFFFNPDIIPSYVRENIELLIGCPTTEDWTGKKEKFHYTQLVKTATKIKNVRIIPESRAAMFSSVENANNQISAVNGAVVFDFGSSTADCTYMLLGRKLLEFSWTLGACEVEHQMLRETLAATMKMNDDFSPDLDNMIDATDELRKAKEAYYNGDFPPAGKSHIFTFTDAETGEPVDGMVRIGEKFMNNVVTQMEFNIIRDSDDSLEGSWEKLCFEFFKEAKRRIEDSTYKNDKGQATPCPISTVIITGGASKMSFIEPLCKTVFNDPEITVITNKINPSHTVSNGLGWVAVTDSHLPKCQQRVQNKVREDSHFDKFVKDVSNDVFAYVIEIAEAEVKAWADLPGDTATVQELKTNIDTAMKQEETAKQLKEICDKNISEWKINVANVIETNINSEMKNLYSENVSKQLILPADIWKELNGSVMEAETIDVDRILDNIDFNSITGQVIRGIVKAVIWVVALLLAPETFGGSLLIGWFASKFAGESMSDNDLNQPRTKAVRENIAKNIGSDLKNKQKSVMEKFEEMLQNRSQAFDPIIDTMINTALEVVTLQRFDL